MDKKEQKLAEWSRQSIIDALTKWLTEKIAPLHKKSLDGTITEREEMFMAALLEIRSLVNSPDFQIGKDISAEWSEEEYGRLFDIEHYLEGTLQLSPDRRIACIDFLKSLRPQPIQLKEAYKEGFQTARHAIALAFMNYLDENRPKGKMSLSNGECEDIDKAFKEGDWAKIMRYVEKYSPQPKQELSEDVKKTLDEVSHILVGLNYKQIAKDYKQAVEKLLSLRPQAKQEWNTYDKALVTCIACCLDGQFVTEAARKQALEWFNKHSRDFLNSPSWKPSEEQMEALRRAVNKLAKSDVADSVRLSIMYDNLKEYSDGKN